MSTKSLTHDDDVTNIKHIGDSRANELGIERVDELAAMEVDELLDELDHAQEDQMNEALKTAREVVTGDPYSPADDAEGEPVQVDEFGGVDEFVEAGQDDGISPQECKTVGIIAGDDAYDDHVVEAEPDEEIAQEVAKRLMEEGFSEAEEIVALENGMGRVAVNEWARYTAQETDIELPELKQVGINRDIESDDWADIYEERDERFLDECDGILVVRNGDFVGKFVNLVADRDGVIIETPDYDEEEEDDPSLDDDDIPDFDEV